VVGRRLDDAELRGRLCDRHVTLGRSSARRRFFSRIRPWRPAPATIRSARAGRERACIVYHRRPLGETDRNRVVTIDEIHFDASGAILPVTITKDGVLRDPISANGR
jgi:hypothetical protein